MMMNGDDENVSDDPSILKEVYSNGRGSDTTLTSASGHSIPVTKVGKAHELLQDVFITENTKGIEGTLISGPRLQERDCWIIGPPRSVSPTIGMIVADLHGKVRMVCDTDNITYLEDIDRSMHEIVPPDISTGR